MSNSRRNLSLIFCLFRVMLLTAWTFSAVRSFIQTKACIIIWNYHTTHKIQTIHWIHFTTKLWPSTPSFWDLQKWLLCLTRSVSLRKSLAQYDHHVSCWISVKRLMCVRAGLGWLMNSRIVWPFLLFLYHWWRHYQLVRWIRRSYWSAG